MNNFRKYTFIIIFIFKFSTNIFAEDDVLVKKIFINGANHLSKKELKSHLSINGTSWIDRKIFKNKPTIYDEEILRISKDELINFYNVEGFVNVKIHPSVEFSSKNKRRVNIIFHIEENLPITIDKINIVCRDSLVCPKIEQLFDKNKNISAKKGAIFRDENIKEDQSKINDFMVSQGYPFVQVHPTIKADTTTHTAEIDWNINSGRLSYLGEVSITSNNRTPDKTILKQLDFKKGDIYKRDKLNKSQLQIFQLGTFHIASIQAKLAEAKSDTIPIEIVTKEAPKHSVKVGVGYGREDKIRTFVDYTILNFTGGARRLHLYAKHSHIEPYKFEATFTQPAFLSPNSTISFSPSIGKVNEVSYQLFGYGANIKFQQKFTNNISGSFSPFYEFVKFDTTAISKNTDIRQLKSAYSKNGFNIGVIFDNSFPKNDPSHGWSVALNNKVNTNLFKGNYPFIKIQAEIKKFIPVGNATTLAFKLKSGIINPINNSTVPVEERFYAGGSRSVRGWQRFMLGPANSGIPTGGNSNLEITFEPRIKIYGPLSMVVFIDAGNVWEENNKIKIDDLKYAVGSGLRFKTPIGPIGFDVATPILESSTKWQFHINIGHSF